MNVTDKVLGAVILVAFLWVVSACVLIAVWVFTGWTPISGGDGVAIWAMSGLAVLAAVLMSIDKYTS